MIDENLLYNNDLFICHDICCKIMKSANEWYEETSRGPISYKARPVS